MRAIASLCWRWSRKWPPASPDNCKSSGQLKSPAKSRAFDCKLPRKLSCVGYVGQRQHREFETIARTRLTEDALQVTFHSVLRNRQLRCDITVLQSARHQVGNLLFTLG